MEGYLRYEGKKTHPQMGLSVLTIDHRTGKIFDENRFNVHDFKKSADDAVAYFQKLPRNLIVLGTVFADVTNKAGTKLPTVLVSYYIIYLKFRFSLLIVAQGDV